MDYNKIKNDRKEYINGAFYEKALRTKVKLYITELDTVMEFEHDAVFMTEFSNYLYTTETLLGESYIIGPGGTYPIELAKYVFSNLKRINGMLSKEVFTKQNAIDAINREDYSSDEEFVQAVESVDWDFDYTQVFNFG